MKGTLQKVHIILTRDCDARAPLAFRLRSARAPSTMNQAIDSQYKRNFNMQCNANAGAYSSARAPFALRVSSTMNWPLHA